jgi:succinate dehydrogenase/fumarate reductase flavoprotein subunit
MSDAGTELAVDVLVIGGGMAGLTAAARAARHGARVAVLEIADTLGGSAAYAGYLWTAPSHEVMAEENPDGDLALRTTLVDRFPTAVEWVRSLDVLCGPPVTVAHVGLGHKFDTMHYVEQCRRTVLDCGGRVDLRAEVTELVTDGGAVTGARARLGDRKVHTFTAIATVLATGGFQADSQLRAERIHPQAGLLTVRSNPNSRGTGLRLAESVGAATGPDDAGFYGHLLPYGITTAPTEFVALALYCSEHALLFNLHNERFVDETIGDHLNAIALMKQPEARALFIGDARTHRDWMTTAYVEGALSVDKYALAEQRGARCGIAADLDEIAMLPPEWGYDGEAVRRAVEQYNQAAATGELLTPGRLQDSRPLNEPPYYIIECSPGITFSFHGIRIDSSARVLTPDGHVVPGLLAAGSDIGGLYNNAYLGGVACAMVFGLQAADTAMRAS